ncbi:hypothetical protein MJO28_014689 [Puccinia striiformis f. sp. tritici]|uniref:Uncharacterized protein n=1 Tax=Puccinia striiformis f. sp. tritici TaxID=168172 RepID=A0ACC0DU68_9BASI|nr:hypothetical protein MJO29_016604 [Puccinia striiformis f. sp. tritici]KAI7939110.1 hypothetical protein MJO28_014689 [Puccinia striiformis f. sp. tritici]
MDLRNDVSRQRRAKCTHCQKIFNHTKPQLLFSHIKDICPNISMEQKLSYLSNSMKSDESTHSISSDEDNGRKLSVTIEPKPLLPRISVRTGAICLQDTSLSTVHAQHELLMLNKIKKQKQLTLSLDGWTNNSGSSLCCCHRFTIGYA